MNKMQRISFALIDVNSVKFAYSVGIEERIYSLLQQHGSVVEESKFKKRPNISGIRVVKTFIFITVFRYFIISITAMPYIALAILRYYYYRPYFDFSKSLRANAHNLINIYESSSSLILSVLYCSY